MNRRATLTNIPGVKIASTPRSGTNRSPARTPTRTPTRTPMKTTAEVINTPRIPPPSRTHRYMTDSLRKAQGLTDKGKPDRNDQEWSVKLYRELEGGVPMISTYDYVPRTITYEGYNVIIPPHIDPARDKYKMVHVGENKYIMVEDTFRPTTKKEDDPDSSYILIDDNGVPKKCKPQRCKTVVREVTTLKTREVEYVDVDRPTRSTLCTIIPQCGTPRFTGLNLIAQMNDPRNFSR